MDINTWSQQLLELDADCKQFLPAMRRVLEDENADTTSIASEIWPQFQEDHRSFYYPYFEAVRTYGQDKPVSKRLVALLNAICALEPDGCTPALGMMVTEYCLGRPRHRRDSDVGPAFSTESSLLI